MTDPAPMFLFVVCQVGAEAALKAELRTTWPEFRFAYSRPGFLTFKLPADWSSEPDFDLKSVFARTYGTSLGRVDGADSPTLVAQVESLAAGRSFAAIHVWERDRALPGDYKFEPGESPLAHEIAAAFAAAHPELRVNRTASVGDDVLDVILVDPGRWWVGFHRAASLPSRWPGGVCRMKTPVPFISRAYYKMREALLWSRLPMAAGDRVVELGSSPGGACQALLEKGLLVTGIDPAEMHESVRMHPNFTHVKKRSAEVRRREFADCQWLTADLNAAPGYTLDAAEAIVTHRATNIRGMILTLKLTDWKLAAEIPEYVQRVRAWGFEHVRVRQLAFNGQEVCLAAARSRSMRRGVSRRKARRPPQP